MGAYQPKPYKQFNRSTGQWVLITPEPREIFKRVSKEGIKKSILKLVK